jgi:uncharacterized membrane protein
MVKKLKVLQLTRLERLMDVVFAIVIWSTFNLLPRPEESVAKWESVLVMLREEWSSFLFVLLATGIVIIYWLQNISLLGNLKKTNGVHTAISIFQLVFVLLFLYAITSGVILGESADSRIFESVTAMMIGVMGWSGWYYAMNKADLLNPELSKEEAEHILQKNLAEPVTAVITIPFAFVGPVAWELSWFLYPFIRYIFSRFKSRNQSTRK